MWLGVHAARALRRRRAATVSVGLAAVAALGWLAGPGAVTAALLDVGWGVVLIIAQEIVAHVLNALGWRFAFARKHAAGLRFPELVRLRVAGDAVNYLTPSATIAGEIARAAMLRGRCAADVAAASIVVAKTAQTLAQGFVIGAGVVALGARLSPGRPAISVLIGSAVAIAGTVLLLMSTRRGRSLAARAWPWLAAIGRRLGEFVRCHPGRAALSTLMFVLAYAWGAFEAYWICRFLHLPVTISTALAIEVLSITVDGMLFGVPAKLGTQEGGKMAVFAALGLPVSLGLAFGVVRHVRELTWAAVGVYLSSAALRSRPAGPGRAGLAAPSAS